jgi:2-methylcitrate dehydratase PrpD
MTVSYADVFVTRIEELLSDDLPIQKAKACLLDYLGCAIAGSASISSTLQDYLAVAGLGSAKPIGMRNGKVSLYDAAFLNGISSHVLELDDGHRAAMMHLGSPILSSLLPVAQTENIDGVSLIRGLIAGYEASIRLAMIVQPAHKKKGYHASGTCGVVGAAIAISVARGFSHKRLVDTFSAALTSTGGLLETIEGSSLLKPYNCARAAVDGIIASNSAYARLSGPYDALGGARGFMYVLSDGVNIERFVEVMELPWQITGVYHKIYSSCRHCHSPIDAALRLKGKFDLSEIQRIKVSTYDLAVFGHDGKDIGSQNAAKMSIPYSVAVALFTGKAGIAEYSHDAIRNPGILSIMEKIDVIEDKELSALVPRIRGATVEVVLKDEERLSARVDYPMGEPENPVDCVALMSKFRGLVGYAGILDETVSAIAQAVDCAENDFADLYQLM